MSSRTGLSDSSFPRFTDAQLDHYVQVAPALRDQEKAKEIVQTHESIKKVSGAVADFKARAAAARASRTST